MVFQGVFHTFYMYLTSTYLPPTYLISPSLVLSSLFIRSFLFQLSVSIHLIANLVSGFFVVFSSILLSLSFEVLPPVFKHAWRLGICGLCM